MLLIEGNQFCGKIVSVMGQQASLNLNEGVLTVKTGDEQLVRCMVPPDYEQEGTEFVEVVGCVREEVGAVDLYVTRAMGDEVSKVIWGTDSSSLYSALAKTD